MTLLISSSQEGTFTGLSYPIRLLLGFLEILLSPSINVESTEIPLYFLFVAYVNGIAF
jgi:hypothetical protein